MKITLHDSLQQNGITLDHVEELLVIAELLGEIETKDIFQSFTPAVNQVARMIDADAWVIASPITKEDSHTLPLLRHQQIRTDMQLPQPPATELPAANWALSPYENQALSSNSLSPLNPEHTFYCMTCYEHLPTTNPTLTGLAFYRIAQQGPFTQRDQQLAKLAMQGGIHHALHQGSENGHLKKNFSKPTLTPRLQQVTQLLLAGQTRKEIAQTLGLSQHTVIGYIKDIYRNLNISTRPELFTLFHNGTLTFDDSSTTKMVIDKKS